MPHRAGSLCAVPVWKPIVSTKPGCFRGTMGLWWSCRVWMVHTPGTPNDRLHSSPCCKPIGPFRHLPAFWRRSLSLRASVHCAHWFL